MISVPEELLLWLQMRGFEGEGSPQPSPHFSTQQHCFPYLVESGMRDPLVEAVEVGRQCVLNLPRSSPDDSWDFSLLGC